MQNFRLYGQKPCNIAVIHGGPGAPGEMAPVARELASSYGVIEPLQTGLTVAGEVEELQKVLQTNAATPAVLIGHSWGAWLSLILAAEHPELVSKLIMVGSAPFEDKCAASITKTRMSRLTDAERSEVLQITMALNTTGSPDKNRLLSRFGELMSKADNFAPLDARNEVIWCRFDIYERVWPEAAELRRSGRLLEYAKSLTLPVIAIHGDYDPHPAEGVREPLARVLPGFKFVLLERCGHTPWNERYVRAGFYRILNGEIETAVR